MNKKYSKRLFFAVNIKPQDELLKFISLVKQELAFSGINWVNTDILHMTIFFVGDFPDSEIDNLINHISKLKFSKQRPIITLKGCGDFKHTGNRILWVGVEDKRKILTDLNQKLNNLLLLNFNSILTIKYSNQQIFKPHLTLARIKKFDIQDNYFYKKIFSEFNNYYFQ